VSLELSVLVVTLHAYGVKLLVTLKRSCNIFLRILNNTEYLLGCRKFGTIPTTALFRPDVFWILVTEGARMPFCMAILYITIDHFLQLFLLIVAFFFSKHKVALNVCIYT